MSIYYQDDLVTLHHGDCLDVLRTLPDCSIDAVVTDPPYGLGFMGKEWDSGKSFVERRAAKRNTFDHVGGNHNPADSRDQQRTRLKENAAFGLWCEEWATECLRVLKPGGHLLAFGGSRTWHRLACAVEDVGFEVRDSIAWLYGSGFPKSLDVSKAIDKAAGHWRGRAGEIDTPNASMSGANYGRSPKGDPVTAAAAAAGWGTALKPAFEPIVVARKPLAGTVAANVLAHGVGALNIDACRIATDDRLGGGAATVGSASHAEGWERPWKNDPVAVRAHAERVAANVERAELLGRWPANVVLDESQAAALDQQSGELTSGSRKPGTYVGLGYMGSESADFPGIDGDTGGASRFFYVAKADHHERVRVNGVAHPTVKPLELMRWLIRLVTPPGGTVLEPFAGSGTTVEACLLEGMRCIAIEREADYLPLVQQRIDRRLHPVAAVRGAGEDGGLFDLLDKEGA